MKLSIITPTLNNEGEIKYFLQSIKKQSILKGQLEVIISDGGSTDKTLEIARKMGARIIKNPDVFPDPGVNRGIKVARGEVLMVLACDNIYKNKNSLKTILSIFEDREIFAAFPKQATSKKDTIYTNYINTFTDPASHFVYGYASNPRTFGKVYKNTKTTKEYQIFDYKSSKFIPLISFAQGFTFRKGFRRNKNNEFDDVAPVMEIIRKNRKIAYLYSIDLYHHTIRDLAHFIRKQSSKTKNYLNRANYGIAHRAGLLSDEQTRRIKIWPYYSLTIIPPFVYALYHLVKDREKMWIFHPFLCIISGYTSFFTLILFFVRKQIK